MRRIDAYLGLGSRYSYLAFTQIARLEQSTGCRFALNAVSSVELMALRGRSPFEGEPTSGQYDWCWRQQDAKRWAAYYGVPYREPAPLPSDHRLMARACHAAGAQGATRAYFAALYRAVFAEHCSIDREACIGLAVDIGIDGRRFAGDLDGRAVDDGVTAAAVAAHRRGAFGVPTFFDGDAMVWGNDRLPLLEHRLRSPIGVEPSVEGTSRN